MEDNFSNKQVEITQLPSVEEVVFSKLDHQYFRLEIIWAAIRLVVFFGIGIGAFFVGNYFTGLAISKTLEWGIFLSCLLIGVISAIVGVYGFHYKGYAIRQHDIIYKTGLINRKQLVVPYNRVQHVEVYQGAVSRMFGLCELVFFTAGGQLGDLCIPGLTLNDAEKIKTFVITKVQPLAEVKHEITLGEDE
ncbi:PH domain-containing protein [Myroides pelagicus]|uniref:PH domain-containing protein n=1 Tax=Myroides pelagicus TaxID=270914 RepID=A0A7K1GNT6_9FLAO|nr:PH domain-containing protein [Myroides pelagicus]MEC4114350.1 PH domain-containing protein [Myroides pelagicus]MTH29874.1 PH domain-containing protein [Myroides pelagicus]